jgi:hypothetical protein
MEENEKIEINEASVNSYSENFLQKSKSNQFYDKQVFFTQKLCCSRHKQFQVIGNLGGIPTDTEFTPETDFYIISDFIFEELKQGFKDNQLIELEDKLNAKGKKYGKLKILTEKVFLEHIQQRCLMINDQVTLDLIKDVL